MERETSPVVAVLQAVASRGRVDGVRVVSYRRREEFLRLWGVDESVGTRPAAGLLGVLGALQEACVRTLVIVWDGAPQLNTGPVDTTRYLTPLDWVMALACELEADAEDRAELTVWILRLPHQRAVASATEQFVDGIPGRQAPGIPWAHLCRIGGDDGDKHGPRALLEALAGKQAPASGTSAWRRWFNRKAETQTSSADVGTLLPAKGVWTAALTRQSADASHHDVANLLAPLRLLREPELPDVAPLRQLALSLGLFPHGGRDEFLLDEARSWLPDGEDPDWRALLKGARTGNPKAPIRVYFVDDLWRLGWGAVLCHAFGASRPPDAAPVSASSFREIGRSDHFCVLAVDGPKPLVRALRDGNGLRFAFSLATAPQPGDEEADVERQADAELAVLDLRLFAGRSLAEEAAFFEELVDVTRAQERRAREAGDSLPWPPVDDAELTDIEDWCRQARAAGSGRATRNDPAYLDGMTLLPRLVALADPAYPLIVFSSTGQRRVVEKLRPYGSLITVFEKPRVAALGADDVALRTASGFRRALREALELLAVRRCCLALPPGPVLPRSAQPDAANPASEQAVGQDAGDHWTVEVLLDETDSKTPEGSVLTVGGLTVVYPPATAPDAFDEKLWVRFETYAQGQQAAFKNQFKHPLRKNIAEVAGTVEAMAAQRRIAIAAVAVSADKERPQHAADGDALFDERQHDNLHRELVRAVIEGAVYEVARGLVQEHSSAAPRVRLDVRLGTRVRPLSSLMPNDAEPDQYMAMLWNNLGIDCFIPGPDGLVLVGFMNEGGARPLVEEVIQHYQNSTFRPTPRVAVALRLNTSQVRRPPLREWEAFRAPFLHYVADALLSRPLQVPRDWWLRGFGAPEYTGTWYWRTAPGAQWSNALGLPEHVRADRTRYQVTPPIRWRSRHRQLRSLFDAQRHLLAGETQEALAVAVSLGIEHQPLSEGSLEQRIARRLRPALPTLSGDDILRLRRTWLV